MAPIFLVYILPVYSGVNTREQNGCHAPLLSDYSSTSKSLLARKCEVALERYRTTYYLIHFSKGKLNVAWYINLYKSYTQLFFSSSSKGSLEFKRGISLWPCKVRSYWDSYFITLLCNHPSPCNTGHSLYHLHIKIHLKSVPSSWLPQTEHNDYVNG